MNQVPPPSAGAGGFSHDPMSSSTTPPAQGSFVQRAIRAAHDAAVARVTRSDLVGVAGKASLEPEQISHLVDQVLEHAGKTSTAETASTEEDPHLQTLEDEIYTAAAKKYAETESIWPPLKAKDPRLVIAIAKLAAQKSGYGTSEHIKNYGITDQTALIEIAKLAAQLLLNMKMGAPVLPRELIP